MTTARKLAVGLVAALLATLAWAQDAAPEDDVLQRYALATESLEQANAAMPDDTVAARSELDRAFSALLTLSRGGSGTLGDSLDRVFERARTAIENRSATDLAVQTTVLRGGFQRLLYESALTAAVEGRPELARSRLLRLADDVGLAPERLEQLRAQADAGGMRRVFEAGVAESVATRLDALAAAGAPEDRDAAYRSLAGAYGDYLLVQDSGRIDPASNRRFVESAEALVDGDDEAYLASLAALSSDLSALRDAADAGTPERAPTAEPDAGAVAELPSGDEEPAPATPAEQAPAGDAGEAAPAEEATPAEAAAGEGEIDLEALREEIAAELEAEREAEALAALEAELAGLGIGAGGRADLAARLRADDVVSVGDLERELAALASRLEAATLRGDATGAREALAEARTRYSAGLGTVVAVAEPQADAALRDTFARLDEAPALRVSDAALLSSELQAVSERLRGRTVATSHRLAAGAAGLWPGWIRPVAMIVLALLALLPLRLLGLAFGGGNPNWRLVGTALFLLVLPVLVEGVIALAALAAGPLGLPALAGWTMASVFASDLTQMVWAAVMLIAIALASIGFYGICVQFGVLGRRRSVAAAPSGVRTRDDTLVDWDDDF